MTRKAYQELGHELWCSWYPAKTVFPEAVSKILTGQFWFSSTFPAAVFGTWCNVPVLPYVH